MTPDKNKAPSWEIESIFPGGSGSREFAEFRKKIVITLNKAEKTLQTLQLSKFQFIFHMREAS